MPIGRKNAPARYRTIGIRILKTWRNHRISPDCPQFIPITTIAAMNGPKAARTKKGVRLSSGTDDSAGINIAQVIANVNTKYSAVKRRVNWDWYVLVSVNLLHSILFYSSILSSRNITGLFPSVHEENITPGLPMKGKSPPIMSWAMSL